MSNTSSYFHGYVVYEDITPLIENAKLLLKKEMEDENKQRSQKEKEEEEEAEKKQKEGQKEKAQRTEVESENHKKKEEAKSGEDKEWINDKGKQEEEQAKEERRRKDENDMRQETLDSTHEEENYFVNAPTEIRMKQKKYYYPSVIGVKTSAMHHFSFQCLLEEMYKILYAGKVIKNDKK